jgi:hypothetical protein
VRVLAHRFFLAVGKIQKSDPLKLKILFSCNSRADRIRRLESVTMLALRTPLAAPMNFDSPFCCEAQAIGVGKTD